MIGAVIGGRPAVGIRVFPFRRLIVPELLVIGGCGQKPGAGRTFELFLRQKLIPHQNAWPAVLAALLAGEKGIVIPLQIVVHGKPELFEVAFAGDRFGTVPRLV